MTGIVVALICTMVPARRRQVWAAWTSVIGCAALVSITSTWCADLMAWQDPVSARIRDGPVSAMVDAEVIGPVMMPISVAWTVRRMWPSERRRSTV